jgi:hypothetical protein
MAYPWIVRRTAIVNHFYVYAVDADFGPFFIKFCTYFPYNAKLCCNGHEWAKRQATKAGIAFEELDNGFLSCDTPAALQRICDRLTPAKIDRFVRKWLARLPHPFTADDRRAGYRYDISVLQAEFSLTQVLDRPLSGRVFFEEVVRENVDIGRPDRVSLIFDRKVIRRGRFHTPGRFRTRVFTHGVTPSLHLEYKHSRVKQYHKEGRALRTETTINDSRDFGVGKRLCNLPALREVGYAANRRLLDVERLTHEPWVGDELFAAVTNPIVTDTTRVAGLRFTEPRVQTLLHALVLFRQLPNGFSNADLRAQVSALCGQPHDAITAGRMTYDLRRLRLHGLIQRIPRTHRYHVTQRGLRTALLFTRTYNRLLRPALAQLGDSDPPGPAPIRAAIRNVESTIDQALIRSRLAA